MTGHEYADLIAAYITQSFGSRGIVVYREVNVGTSIIGKNRRIDVFIHSDATQKAMALECKFQGGQGTADEKIPYALDDVKAMWMPACIVYAGEGFSQGVLHMLQGSEFSAYCLPEPTTLNHNSNTKELDHILASVFGWWDIILANKNSFDIGNWSPAIE